MSAPVSMLNDESNSRVVEMKNCDDTSHYVYEFEWPHDLTGRLIGKKEKHFKFIKKLTNASLCIKRHRYNNNLRLVVVEGCRSDVNNALSQIRKRYPLSQYPNITLLQTNVPVPESLQRPKIFVGNLPDRCKKRDLRQLFEKYGVVKECDVINKYGFVHMTTLEEAEAAIKNLNNYNLMGSCISVEPSKSKLHPERGAPKRSKKSFSRSAPSRNGYGSSCGSYGSSSYSNGYRPSPSGTPVSDPYCDRPFGYRRERMHPYPSPYERRSPVLTSLQDEYARRLPSGTTDPYSRHIPSLGTRDDLYELIERTIKRTADYLYSRLSPPSSSLSRNGDPQRDGIGSQVAPVGANGYRSFEQPSNDPYFGNRPPYGQERMQPYTHTTFNQPSTATSGLSTKDLQRTVVTPAVTSHNLYTMPSSAVSRADSYNRFMTSPAGYFCSQRSPPRTLSFENVTSRSRPYCYADPLAVESIARSIPSTTATRPPAYY